MSKLIECLGEEKGLSPAQKVAIALDVIREAIDAENDFPEMVEALRAYGAFNPSNRSFLEDLYSAIGSSS